MKDIPLSPRIIEIKRKRRAEKWRKTILFIILFGVIVYALSFFSNNERITISKVEITGNHIISSESIEEKVFADISGKYLHLFSRANTFIYPREKIARNLVFNFPRIEEISVYRDGFKMVHIDMKERVGSYLYCGASVPVDKNEIGENCYFINDDGFVFDKAPYFSGNIYFKYYVDIKEVDPLGKQMLPRDEFHKLMRFVEGVRSIGFTPIYLVMTNDNTNHLYLESSSGSTKPEIIFKNDVDFDVLLENLSLAMKKKEFTGEINSKYSSLLYIDLRFKNKVLYKFQ